MFEIVLPVIGIMAIGIVVMAAVVKCAEAVDYVMDFRRKTDAALKRIEAALKEKETQP